MKTHERLIDKLTLFIYFNAKSHYFSFGLSQIKHSYYLLFSDDCYFLILKSIIRVRMFFYHLSINSPQVV